MDTINRLLKKQAPKKRGRAAANLDADSGAEEEQEVEKAPAVYVRYIQNSQGTMLCLPGEWLEAPVGEMFSTPAPPSKSGDPSQPKWSRRMVEEVG